MPFQDIPIESLVINRANDRHGELENETAAMAELFRIRETHMRKLAEDIVSEGAIYDAPLVASDGSDYLVFDGNRRLTCMKLILNPARAPTQALQTFFQQLQSEWTGPLPVKVVCQIEDDREKVDSILYRRHTGTQGGVGQTDWDDRAQRNFIERSGRGGRINVADEVEALLAEEDQLPEQNIPRSTMNRLLSSEAYRNRVGISVQNNKFNLTHDKDRAVVALARVATDLASRRVVLGDLWDNSAKLSYLNRLEVEGVLPPENTRVERPDNQPAQQKRSTRSRGRPQARQAQVTFIPVDGQTIPWRGDQVRAHQIWLELQGLRMDHHPNAVAAMVRVLLELAVTGYIQIRGLKSNDTLSSRVGAVARDLLERDIIDRAYHDEINRLRQGDRLISINSLQRLLHSADFAPVESELLAYWARLGRFLTATLTH